MMNSTIPTIAALSAAYALAGHYGHLWTYSPLETLTGKTLPQISEMTEQQHANPNLPGGIYAPMMDEYGDLSHVTGSGRLSWLITPSGLTHLRIHRPTNPDFVTEWVREEAGRENLTYAEVMAEAGSFDVINVVLPSDQELGNEPYIATDYCYVNPGRLTNAPQAFPRHIDAAIEALKALNGVSPHAQAAINWLENQRDTAQKAERYDRQQRHRDFLYGQGRTELLSITQAALKKLIHSYGGDAPAAFRDAHQLLQDVILAPERDYPYFEKVSPHNLSAETKALINEKADSNWIYILLDSMMHYTSAIVLKEEIAYFEANPDDGESIGPERINAALKHLLELGAIKVLN